MVTKFKYPWDRPVFFPDVCAFCGADHPDAFFEFELRRESMERLMGFVGPGARIYRFEVPTCARHRWFLRMRIKVVKYLMISFALILAAVGFWIADKMTTRENLVGISTKTTAIVCGAIGIGVVWQLNRLFPPPIAIGEAWRSFEDIEVAIADAKYAAAFAAVNRGAS